ncbi:MAG: HIT domain-containing protein [Gammaproteobacteria bacterium]|nr:HIT domain-containing protein [Gammaproteobacteria bacterium]
MTFTLHPRLAADTFLVGDLPLCRVLLMNDANFPWLILVPRQADRREIHELAEADQQRLVTEVSLASRQLQAWAQADKMNVAALGNQVPQLHVHVIARRETDPAWPRPVWGVLPPDPYPQQQADTQLAELKALFEF